MSAAPEVINPQNVAKCWKGMLLDRKDGGKGPTPARLTSGDASSSGDEFNTKVRKPYTITKQRERWTESEHQKFLEALKLYGRAWRRIEEYVGTKTAVQIRSHAQKFFSKLEREASTGSSAGKTQDIEIPPPRPKRKPSHPYPKKAGNGPLNLEDENKELSLPSAGMAAVHHEDFKLVSKGLGSAFNQSPYVPGHCFGSKGSMKLFGKTVVVPKPHKPASQTDASNDNLVDEEISSLDIQTNKSDLKQFGGFSSFLKVRKNIEKFSEASLQLDRNGSEGTCVSLARSCRDDSAGTDEPEAADAQFLGKGREQQHRSRVEASLRKNEKTFPPPQKDGEKVDAQFPHGVHQNNIMHQWIDNFFHYNTGLSFPPMAAHGLGDGVSADPLTYWQCMQASAVNYAAYTAAMAAAVAAGWTGSIAGGRESTEALPANIGEAQVSLSFGNELCPKALSSAASCCWWPFRGFIPPGPCPPPRGALHPGEDQDISANANPLAYAKRNGTLDGTDLETAGEEEASEPFSKADIEDDEQNNTEISPSAKSGCVLGTSCVTEAPGSERALPDLKCQHEVDAKVMFAKCATQGSDTERTAAIESPQNLYSSSDEFEGQGKKPGEGSSSGSNTPASRFQSSEFEAPTMMQSKKRNCYTLLKDYDDTCSDGFKISHQQCVGSTVESPKFRLKHAEKGRKHQQKDFRHSCSDDSKRLKSSAHELELRKEVSHEGRKAFQALFTSKLLPQSFPAANMADHRDVSFREEHISRPTVSKSEPGLSNVSEPIESASDECVNTGGCPQGKIYGDDHSSGNNSSGIGANLEMGIGYSMLDSQHEVDSKNFTVSMSSGFVPYRRPPCLEPMILDQPSSL